MKMNQIAKSLFLCGAALALSSAVSQAVTYQVSINTTALVSSLDGPFSLDFQLNSGGTLGNNSATISNITGVSPTLGAPDLIGGASGDLGATVVINDTNVFNEFYQTFTVSNTITFDVTFTNNIDSGLTPDSFSVAILDSSDFNITTNGVGNTLFQYDFDGSPDSVLGQGTGAYSGVTVTAVPEASSALLGVLGVSLSMIRRRPAA
jgi:hypothetical protein